MMMNLKKEKVLKSNGKIIKMLLLKLLKKPKKIKNPDKKELSLKKFPMKVSSTSLKITL